MTDQLQQQEPAPSNEPPETPAPAEQPSAPDNDDGPTFIDPDAAELAAALKAVEEEDAAAGGGGQAPDGQSGGDPAAEPEPTREGVPAQGQGEPQQPQGARQEPDPVPYARFREVNEAARLARERAIYLEGQMEALRAALGQQGQKPQQAGQQPQQQAEPSIPERIEAERQRLLDATTQYDEGKISLSQLERVRFQTDDAIAQLREEALRRAAAAAAPQAESLHPSLADETILQYQLTQLEQAHPALRMMSDADIEVLGQMARTEAARQGRPIGVGPRETLRLRQMAAELADVMAPRWYPNSAPQPGTAPNGAAPPATQQTAGQPGAPAGQQALSPAAQSRLQKLNMAAAMPPDTHSMGGAGRADHLSDASIEAMSDEEILALPPSLRNRYLDGG